MLLFYSSCRVCKSKKYYFVSNANFRINFLSARFSVCKFVFLIFNILFCLSDLTITSFLVMYINAKTDKKTDFKMGKKTVRRNKTQFKLADHAICLHI